MSSLARARCHNHPRREAAARCPACGSDFCRECVVEHEGRLLCSACLGKAVGGAGRSRHRWVRYGARAASVAVGFLLVWFFFFAVGDVLSRTRDTSHAEIMDGF
jgi:hypothetical protein